MTHKKERAMLKNKWIVAVLITSLVIFSSYLILWIKPYFVTEYGLDPAVIAVLFVAAEALFNISIAIMLWYSGIKPNLSNIKKLKLKEFRASKNTGATTGLILNRASWIMPFAYILYVGWSRLPWFIICLVFLEIAITLYVGVLMLGLFDKHKLKIRPATQDDLDGIMKVDAVAWGDTFPATREMFSQRIINFPEGGVIVAEYCDKIVATLSLELLEKENLPTDFTWDQVSSNGTLTGTHDPNGTWIYGIGLASTPLGSKCGATKGLILYAGKYIISHNKKGAILMARMPGYHKYANSISPEEYATKEKNGRPIDPEIAIYKTGMLTVIKPVIVIKDYMTPGSDERSCGYSVMVGWTNPFYNKGFSKLWSCQFHL